MQTPPPLLGRDAALFLDFDGTLVAIADTPEAVQVPDTLVELLRDLHRALGGAVAVVSGRQIDNLDRFLQPLRLAAAGEHGVERRDAKGHLHEQPAIDLGPALGAANTLAAHHAGLLVERKQAAIALHYRLAPELETLCRERMAEAIGDQPLLELLHGKCVVEVKPAGVNKGLAIEAFLREAPFAERRPVFLGDDVTDESGFAAVQSHSHGIGIKVGPGRTHAEHHLADPPAVLRWLRRSRDALALHGA